MSALKVFFNNLRLRSTPFGVRDVAERGDIVAVPEISFQHVALYVGEVIR